MGESIELYESGKKIWEIRKDYDETTFDDDASSLGYKINVFQETINKMFTEFLVNFDYLERVMENYGFTLITRDEAKSHGLPEGSGLFSELYNVMQDEIKRSPMKREDYGSAVTMNPNEKKISFLNRYFVFKKISHVNAEKVALELIDETGTERRVSRTSPTLIPTQTQVSSTKTTKSVKPAKKLEHKKARPLNKKITLLAATEAIDSPTPMPLEQEEPQAQAQQPQVEENPIVVGPAVEKEKNPRKPRTKKTTLAIEPDDQVPPPTEGTIIKETETTEPLPVAVPVSVEPKQKAKRVTKKKITLKLEEE
jgi:hypothetical protein